MPSILNFSFAWIYELNLLRNRRIVPSQNIVHVYAVEFLDKVCFPKFVPLYAAPHTRKEINRQIKGLRADLRNYTEFSATDARICILTSVSLNPKSLKENKWQATSNPYPSHTYWHISRDKTAVDTKKIRLRI